MRDGQMECGYWRFEFEGSAFLHHMIRNIMGCLIYVGQGSKPVEWMQQVLDARSREVAAPTFSPTGCTSSAPSTTHAGAAWRYASICLAALSCRRHKPAMSFIAPVPASRSAA